MKYVEEEATSSVCSRRRITPLIFSAHLRAGTSHEPGVFEAFSGQTGQSAGTCNTASNSFGGATLSHAR